MYEKEEITLANQEHQNTQQLLQINEEMIEALKHRYDMFVKLQKTVLEENVDYGYPSGQHSQSQKPCLYKSGAEKLSQLFHLIPEFIEIKAIEERNFVMYKFRCELRTQNGQIVGIGYGIATSEEKSHWKQNPLGNANTIIKIAKKRAHVDAVLNGLGASNVFTQDLEDYEPEQIDKNETIQIVIEDNLKTEPTNKTPSQKQKNYFYTLLKEIAKRKNKQVNEEIKYAESLRGKKIEEWNSKDFSNMITLYKVIKIASNDLTKLILSNILIDPEFLDATAKELEDYLNALYTEDELINLLMEKQQSNEEPPF